MFQIKCFTRNANAWVQVLDKTEGLESFCVSEMHQCSVKQHFVAIFAKIPQQRVRAGGSWAVTLQLILLEGDSRSSQGSFKTQGLLKQKSALIWTGLLQIVKCLEVSFCTFQMQWQLNWMFTKLLLQITWNWQSLNLCCDLDLHQSLSCTPVNYLFSTSNCQLLMMFVQIGSKT